LPTTPKNVKAEFTGVIETLPDHTQVLVVERIDDLRFGSPHG
jgi:hypothetical protein